MNDLHRTIASICVHPTPIHEITERAGCTKVTVYNLVTRGLLVNVGSKHRGLFKVADGVVVEAERTFNAPQQIVQVSSVWHYAQRLARNAA